ERQGTDIRALLGSDATGDLGELARLETEVEQNERDLAGLGLREDALDRALEHVRTVFAQPGRHLYVSTRRVRLDRMNVVLDQHSKLAADDFTFRIARLPTTPPRVRAFSLIRVARADMLPEK